MPSLITEGRVNLIDLTDRGTLTAYVNTNQPRIQIYDQDSGVYSPDYTSTPLVITPVVFINETPIALTDNNLSIVWKRKVGNTEYDLGTGESVTDGVLTVSVNLLNNVTPYIVYNAHISYTDSINDYTITTETSTDISLVTSGGIGNSVVFTLYAPEGTVFTSGQGSRRIQTSAYYGSTAITTGAVYKWYDYTSGSWNLIPNEDDDHLIVYGRDIVGQDSFKCVMTYQGTDYTDVITLIDKTDNYQCNIDSTGGEIFKNSTGQTYLVANLYQNGIVTDEVKCSYDSFGKIAPQDPVVGDFYHRVVDGSNTMPLMRFGGTVWTDVTDNPEYAYKKVYTWYRRSATGEAMDNGQPFATGKVIYVDDDSIEDGKCTFVCEVKDDASSPLIATGNYTIVDVTDPIISGSAPLSPKEGMVWIDTNTEPSVMKIYKNGSWKVVGASDDDKNKVFTITPVTPYKEGDLWVNRDDGEIYVCNNTRQSGNFDANDWIPASEYQTSQDVLDELDNFADTVVDPLAARVDNKVETWFQTTDPAAQWTTSADRREHVGDLWYDNTNGSVQLLRYYIVSVNPDVFGWEEIKSQDAIDALAGLDHKITTYRTANAPTGDLVVGDLWVDTDDNNKLYRYDGNNWVDVSDNSLLSAFVTNTYTPAMSALQQSVDQKIETWFQTTDPSTGWNTDSIRASHIGDIWYDNTQDDASLQRWTYDLGIGYHWAQITDQAAIDAYSIASEAKDLADGKRRVFYIRTSVACKYYENWAFVNEQDNWQSVDSDYIWSNLYTPITIVFNEATFRSKVDDSGDYIFTYNGSAWVLNGTTTISNMNEYGIRIIGTPYNGSKIVVDADMSHPEPPYDVGDLWAQGDTGDLLVCGTSKADGQTYSKSDWYPSSGLNYASYQTDTEALRTQLDGKIETWFQDLDPEMYAGISEFSTSNHELSIAIDPDLFEYNRTTGVYIYTYNGTAWTYNGSTTSLGSIGISIVKGTPSNGDRITVRFVRPEDDVPWTTGVKSKHTGDLWYSPANRLLKRYVDYGGNVFAWEVIQDQDAIQALADAAQAQATADGKCVSYYIENILTYNSSSGITASIVESEWNNKVNEESGDYTFTYDGSKWLLDGNEVSIKDYGIKLQGDPVYGSEINVSYTFNHPNPPYDIGDLWIQGRSGNILVCKIAKEDNQSYSRNDWDYSDALKEFVTVTYPEDLDYLEGLIDNKIDTWFQTTDPSSTWNTQDIKRAHVGDMWYKDKDHLYTYTSDYTWQQITDTSIIQVYRNAATAQDTKDGRRRVFVGNVNPTPPYDRGDLWMQGENGDILYCNTSKIEGQTFASTDFVTASKYKSYQIYTGNTAPSDTTLIWLDNTNADAPVMKKYENGQWVIIGTTVNFHTGSTPPTPPYNAGDMWVYYDNQGNVGIRVCVTSKASGNYDPDDWVEGDADFIVRSDTEPDHSKLWYNVTNNILYMYDYDSSKWVEVGDLSSVADITAKNNVSIISLNKNMSRVLDATYTLDVIPSNTSRFNASLDKSLWMNGNSSGKSPSPYVNVYGELVYAYGPAVWGTFMGYKSGNVVIGEVKWSQIKANNGNRTWAYYHDTKWRKRFEQESIVGSSGSASDMANNEYITISGTPQSGDYVTLKNYSTNTSLGFVVSDYYEEYQYVEGELTSIGNKVEVISTAFSFESNGLHIFDGRQDVSDPSELVLGHSQVTLGYRKGGTPDITIDHDGVTAPHLTATLTLDVRNTIILGKYKLDCSFVNKTAGVTISYVG